MTPIKGNRLMTTQAGLAKRMYVGLFLVTLATLMYEILLTRIFSVTMWYHFAFGAISIAMFGMTVGAIIVYLRPNTFTEDRVRYHMAASALLFAVTVVISFLTHICIPVVTDSLLLSITGLYALILTYVVISVPFIFSGICVCLALTRFPRNVSKLYAADLAGAALGCVLVIYALKVTDGPTAVFIVALLAGIGSVVFATEAGHVRMRRLAIVASLGLFVFAAGHTVLVHKQHPLVRLMWVKNKLEYPPLYEKWNSFSRVTVRGSTTELRKPFGWGLSSIYPKDRRINQLGMTIDAGAGTVLTAYNETSNDVEHLKYDLINLVHYIRPESKVLVVGTGGGRDILSALAFGQESVLGVEINENIVNVVNNRFGDFTGHLDRRPEVTFVVDEARSYIARQEDKFDIIQVSLIDTAAASAAGAFVLTENSLYTVEAWKIFLEHLTDNGVLTFSRWYFGNRPAEVYRLTALGCEALMQVGVDAPRKHIIIVRQMDDRGWHFPVGVATMLVSKAPFSDKDLSVVTEVTDRMKFERVLTPDVALDPTFEKIASGKDLEAFTSQFPLNIAAPTDDSPFFFHMLRLGNMFSREVLSQGEWDFNHKAVYVLAALLLTVFLLTLLCIIVPLVLTTKKATLTGALPLFLFFACIGFGFLLVEISQMQRLIVFLGHPTYGLSVVLFSLLLSSGCGSYWTQTIGETKLMRTALAHLLALVGVLALFGLLTPHAMRAFQESTTPLRILVATGILLPLGLFMGMAFPLGMKMASDRSAVLTPWLWGINGATSVCASVLAVAIALSAGISTSYWTGVSCYVVAVAAFLWAGRRRRP